MKQIWNWLDENTNTPQGKLLNQILPVGICLILYVFFVLSSKYFITDLINPKLVDKIVTHFNIVDVLVGFFLYFVTAVDYALVVGRMQVSNPGSKARVVMNIMTCVGCYIGVTIVLFLWGFAKEINWLIIPILVFAGSVMIKLAFEGLEYFENSKSIPGFIAKSTAFLVRILNYLSRIFTFWMPEISKPDVKPMKVIDLAKWSLLLPFIIGLDDLIGYMGAMTIYNVFGLLIGIYFADILIDILIFVSPSLTKKIVQSSLLSFIATFAFLYLAYKSYSETFKLVMENYHIPSNRLFIDIGIFVVIVILFDIIMAKIQNRKSYISNFMRIRE